MLWILYIILAVISASPVILIKMFMEKAHKSPISIGLLIIKLVLLYTSVVSGYIYFIYNKISIAKFYPIIKCVELLIPIIFTVTVYGTKLNLINYIGILFAFIAIICIHWK
jgi:drug/metabolite transporter (DMT)-like permease